MRAGALAVVALVAAALGAAGALVVGQAAGWIDGETAAPHGRRPDGAPTGTGGSRGCRGPAARQPLRSRRASTRARRRASSRSTPSSPSGERVAGLRLRRLRAGPRADQLARDHDRRRGRRPCAARRSVYVVFADGDRLPASIVGWDLFNDTGVIKVDPRDHAVSPLPLGDSSRVVVGEPVAAIGSPFGNENSLAVGVVSAVARSIPSLTSGYYVSDAIQIDAPINHGNSGGPLLDAAGRVIGINAQIRSDSGNAEGVGFAIPINSARRSMEQLIATGRSPTRTSAITTQDVTPALARALRPRRPARGADPGGRRGRARPSAPACAGRRGEERLQRLPSASAAT